MNRSALHRVPFLPVLPALLLAAPLWAASPRDEVLRLVPEDVGVCLLVQDLRGHVAALADSPFAAQLQASVVGRAILAMPEAHKLHDAEQVLKQHLNTDWTQLRDDVLGDAFVFAYRPGPPDKPEQEEGFFLVRARNAALLDKLIARLNTAQKQAGDLRELEERQHNGVKYYRRAERKQAEYYYWLHGPVLAVSGQETMLHRIIDLDRQAPSADTAPPPLARALRELGIERSLLAAWFNPRAFDPDLEQKARAAAGSDAAFLNHFLTYWKALDGLAVFVAPGASVEVGVAFKARTEQLPSAARQFLESAGQPSEVWSAFPDDALLAVASRVDLSALLEMVAGFLTPEARKGMRESLERGSPLGKVGKDVFPFLGPDVGFCVLAPEAQDKAWFPRMLYALRVQPGNGARPVDQVLLDAMNFFSGLAVFDWNSKHADRVTLKTVTQDKAEVRYFINDKFPPGLQPAYALKAGYLLLASSPEALQRFGAIAAREPAAEAPLLHMSLTAVQNYLTQRRAALTEFFAEKNHIAREEVDRKLDTVLTGMQFFQSVELTQRVGPGQAVLTLRVRTVQPLRK